MKIIPNHNKIIKKQYIAILESATTLTNLPYQDWRKEKYVGKKGLLLVIENGNAIYLQWNLIENAICINKKGLVTTNGHLQKHDCDTIKFKSLNSYYQFHIINETMENVNIDLLTIR